MLRTVKVVSEKAGRGNLKVASEGEFLVSTEYQDRVQTTHCKAQKRRSGTSVFLSHSSVYFLISPIELLWASSMMHHPLLPFTHVTRLAGLEACQAPNSQDARPPRCLAGASQASSLHPVSRSTSLRPK